jgi:cell division protein FtsI (penicillin-binding protein 3)
VQGNLFPPALELDQGPRLKRAAGDLGPARKKILWFGILVSCWGALIFMRLAYLQVVRRDFFEEKARAQQQRTLQVAASRGFILDRRARELAVSVPVDSICAMPAEISDPASTARILARILGVSRQELEKKFKVRRGFCWVARLVEPELAERVRALNLKGIYFQKESKRFYPKGFTAAHLIGVVGLDQIGLAGLEQAREEELQGVPGTLVLSTDARQRHFAGTLSQEPEPGLNLVLTIDERIQYVAERELQQAIARTGAAAGSIVILEPATGALLAVANHPSFDPNQPVRSKTKEELAQELERRRNHAISSIYEPGSTFKLVTIAAALEEKLTRPDEVLDCQMGAIYLHGHRIRDHKRFGLLTVEQVLARSSDVGTIKLGMRLGERRFYQWIRRFGFGRPTGLGLPGEAAGLTKPAERWSKVSIGAISMGQEIGITAIQLVQAVGAIANHGLLVPPRVLEATFETGGQPVPVERPAARRVLSPETAIQVKRMMEQVVLNGTGKLGRLDGYTAGGKTGTAQKLDPRTRTYSKTDYVASFVGFAPLQNPAIVVAVVLDSPRGLHSGGGVAAPIFPRVAQEVLRYLEVPQDVPVDPVRRARRAPPDSQLLADVSDLNPENERVGEFPLASAPEEEGALGREAAPAPSSSPEPLLLAAADGAVPNFYGKPVRAVLEEATALGLEVDLRGSGLARRQSPEPGSRLATGVRVTVEFER